MKKHFHNYGIIFTTTRKSIDRAETKPPIKFPKDLIIIDLLNPNILWHAVCFLKNQDQNEGPAMITKSMYLGDAIGYLSNGDRQSEKNISNHEHAFVYADSDRHGLCRLVTCNDFPFSWFPRVRHPNWSGRFYARTWHLRSAIAFRRSILETYPSTFDQRIFSNRQL